VHSQLGPGLLEKVYEEALIQEFQLQGIQFENQKEIFLVYKGKKVGRHKIDFLIENTVVVELKFVQTLHPIFKAQVLTYLRASGKRIGLLINFNVPRVKEGIKRLIL